MKTVDLRDYPIAHACQWDRIDRRGRRGPQRKRCLSIGIISGGDLSLAVHSTAQGGWAIVGSDEQRFGVYLCERHWRQWVRSGGDDWREVRARILAAHDAETTTWKLAGGES